MGGRPGRHGIGNYQRTLSGLKDTVAPAWKHRSKGKEMQEDSRVAWHQQRTLA